MITEEDIITLGFVQTGMDSSLYKEFSLGAVKVHIYEKTVLKIFIKNVRISGVDNAEELHRICDKVNKV